MTPFKIPTVILAAAGSGMTCAGRNSLNRYLRATGFLGAEVETTQETPVIFSALQSEPLMSHSIMKLPVKVPGREELVFLKVPILDENERLRDFPIKLSEHLLPHADDRTLYPTVLLPKSGKAYDLFPFPAEGDRCDEGQTVIYNNEEGEPLLPKKKLEQELAKGIICVVFTKLNGEERRLRGTTNIGFIPKQLHPNCPPIKQIGEDQVVMFDVDIQRWRSCKYSNINELRVRLQPYNTFPGTVADLEECFNQCTRLGS